MRGRLGNRFIVGIFFGPGGIFTTDCLSEQAFEFGIVEPDEIEVEVLGGQGAQFARQHLLVPPRALGDPVVGNRQRPALNVGQMIEAHNGNIGETKLSCRQYAAVTRDDGALLVDQNRIHEAEFSDRPGDLGDLRLRVRARIAP